MKAKIQELHQIIENNNLIIIHRHINPDGDAFGSQFGLKEWIKLNYPEKKVYAVSEKDESSFLKEFFPIEDRLTKKDYESALVIIVDTPKKNRIANNLWKYGKTLIKIDHHEIMEKFGDWNWEEPEASSCSEMISEFIFSSSKTKINEEICKYLYIGIIMDTGRFLYSGLSFTAFREASNLIKNYDLNSKLDRKLFYQPTKILRLQSYIYQNYRLIGNVSYILLKKNLDKKYGLTTQALGSQVNVLLNDINVDYCLYGVWDPKNKFYKYSLRSRKKRINCLAEKYNGGGHKLASGGTLFNRKDFFLLLKDLLQLANES